MLSLCSSSVDILRNLAAISSTVSVCTKHILAARLQALSKSCPLITAPRFCGCMCLGKECRTAGKWKQKPAIRCQWFGSLEGWLSSWLGKKHVCRRKGSSRKGSRGKAWWLTALWDGRRLKAGWGASAWETGTGSEMAKKRAASEKSSEKSLVVKGGDTGSKAGGLESEENGPLTACIQELGWTPVIWGYPLCTQEIIPKVNGSFLLSAAVQAG